MSDKFDHHAEAMKNRDPEAKKIHALLAIHDLLDERLPAACGEDIGDDKPCPCTRRDGHDGDHRCACDDSQTWARGANPAYRPDDDPDEALASVIEDKLAFTHSLIDTARAAREHLAAEWDVDTLQVDADHSAVSSVRAEEAEDRADMAESRLQRRNADVASLHESVEEMRERLHAEIRRADEAEFERDEARKALDRETNRYEALRSDVERGVYHWLRFWSSHEPTRVVARTAGSDFAEYLRRDDERRGGR